jgi:carboxymethylenebutenolidase
MSAQLSPEQQAMVATWDAHTAAEFADHDIDKTMATMSSNPFVNHVPVMTGGVGDAEVRQFYSNYFLSGHPKDTVTRVINRTVGSDCLVDELQFSFTHDIELPWILPGVPPTGRHVDIAVVAVVQFRDGGIAGERIYWDQASVLAQVGLIDAASLPVTSAEAVRKAGDVTSEASNTLIQSGRRAKP